MQSEINKIPLSPHLLLNLYGVETWALLDTGSQITAVSETFYETLSKKGKLLEMPVSNMIISTAIGKKSTSVKRQILVEFECDGYKNNHICLVIPYLSSDIILGNDWNLKNKIVINYNSRTIQIKDKLINSSTVLFERGTSDRLHTSHDCDVTYIYVIKIEEIESKLRENKKENEEKSSENKNLYSSCIDDDELEIFHDDEITKKGRMNILIREINRNDKNINIEAKGKLAEELRSIASNLTTLTSEGKNKIMELLIKNMNLFIEKPEGAMGYSYKINLIADNPTINRSYTIPLNLRTKAEQTIKKMKEAGVIERACGSICNPMRWVVKSDGSLRPCLDARLLNNVIKDDRESPPIISEIIQDFTNVKYFSKFDLKNGYWQVALHEESRPYTAFRYDTTMYQFTRVPFGLKVAGSAFIRALSKAVENGSEKLHRALRMYIDDMLIGTETIESHMEVLEELFSILIKFNFTLNVSKCEFLKTEILFLGFIISTNGIRPDPQKLDIIRNFEEPNNKRQLQKILGTCNFYRRFHIFYNQLTSPFRELLKDDTQWIWEEKHSKAFTILKERFIEVVCLKHILPDKTFKVQTDACDDGITGVLFQLDDENNKRIISVVSRFLTEAESKYTTTEKELLAIIYTVYKLRYYLIGTIFEIITDHKGLTFLSSTIYHNSRLIRWSLLLQQFSFSVTYCKGSENVAADFFSRNPKGTFTRERENKITIATLDKYCCPDKIKKEITPIVIMLINKESEIFKQILKNIKIEQRKDPGLLEIINSLNNQKLNEYFQIYKDILFQKEGNNMNWRIVIPNHITTELIRGTHERIGHVGVYKSTEYLKRYYYWKGMNKQIKQCILTCDLCQRVKYLSIAMEGEYELVEAQGPGDLATVDFYGPLPRGRGGVQYLFVVLDAFSKLVRLYPMKNATTHMSLKRIFDNYIPECGKPKRILSDNGTQFTSLKWRNALEAEGIKVIFSSIRHPQSNPTERVMREIGRLFRTLCKNNHTTWANKVHEIEEILNITTHFSTQCVPHELHFGTCAKNNIQKFIEFPLNQEIDHEYLITFAREKIWKNFEKRKKNQKVYKIELAIGDRVLLRVRHLSNALDKTTKKFFHLYEGPYIISKTIGKNAYVLADINKGREIGTYNKTNLRKYYDDNNDQR